MVLVRRNVGCRKSDAEHRHRRSARDWSPGRQLPHYLPGSLGQPVLAVVPDASKPAGESGISRSALSIAISAAKSSTDSNPR